MDKYDVMQVCLQGHQITDRYNSDPSERKEFCNKCGAKTIHSCSICKRPIKGDFIPDEVCFIGMPEELDVPKHCEGCGTKYPWAKGLSFSFTNLRLKFKELSMLKKIGLIGSIASIISVGLYFAPSVSSETSVGSINQSSSNNSTSVGVNEGNITINNASTKNTSEVLRLARSSLILKKPTFQNVGQSDAAVCSPISGTKVVMTGNVSNMGGIPDFWKEVKIMNGACAGKVGWTSMENIKISAE